MSTDTTDTDLGLTLLRDAYGISDAPWTTPTTPTTLPFPTTPGLVGEYAAAVAAHYQVPEPFAFLVCLAAPAVATVGRYSVAPWPGWEEAVTVYVAAVLPPGERKSPTLRHVVAPLRDLESEAMHAARPERARALDAQRLAQSVLDKAVKAAAATPDDPAALADMDAARERLDALRVPPVPRLFADDVTPEALAFLLADHRALAVMEAEGGLFGTLAGRYAEGRPNLDGVNKAFSREPFKVDRKGSDPVWCEDPHLTLALCVQPQVLTEVRKDRELVGRGFPARFLYACPPSMLGHRLVATAPTVPTHLDDAWARSLGDLYARSTALTSAQVLTLTPAGGDLFRTWCEDHELTLRDNTSHMGGWAGKLPGQVLRIAALLTLADTPTATAVDTAHLSSALTLAEPLRVHAHKALRGGTGLTYGAERVLTWLAAEASTKATQPGDDGGSVDSVDALRGFTFTTRDAHRALSGQVWADSATAVRDALTVLCDHGWVRRNTPPPGKPGRPTEAWTAHPDLRTHLHALSD